MGPGIHHEDQASFVGWSKVMPRPGSPADLTRESQRGRRAGLRGLVSQGVPAWLCPRFLPPPPRTHPQPPLPAAALGFLEAEEEKRGRFRASRAPWHCHRGRRRPEQCRGRAGSRAGQALGGPAGRRGHSQDGGPGPGPRPGARGTGRSGAPSPGRGEPCPPCPQQGGRRGLAAWGPARGSGPALGTCPQLGVTVARPAWRSRRSRRAWPVRPAPTRGPRALERPVPLECAPRWLRRPGRRPQLAAQRLPPACAPG